MKRSIGKFLAFILTIALVFGLQAGLSGSSVVYAADTDYGLIFDATAGGFWLDEDGNGTVNFGDSPYTTGQGITWSWNSGTSTLTLTDFEWETPAGCALKIIGDVTLNLVGTNNFTSVFGGSTAYTLGISAVNLIVTGDGALSAQGGNAGGGASYGILSKSLVINSGTVRAIGCMGDFNAGVLCDEFTISGGSLEAVGGSAAYESRGVYVYESATISGGELTATAGSAAHSAGIGSDEFEINISGGTVTATGETFAFNAAPVSLPTAYNWFASATLPYTPSGPGTNATDTAYVWNGAQKFVKITPEVSLDDFALIFDVATGKFYYDVDDDADPTNTNNIEYTEQSGAWSWDNSTKTLTLDGFTYISKAFDALIIVGGNLIINLKGVNTFEVPEAPGHGFTSGITALDGDLTINGTGALNAKGGSSSIYTDLMSAGISVGGVLKVESGTVNATGGDVEAVSFGVMATNDIMLSGGILNAKGGVSEGDSIGLDVYGDITLSGGTLNATGGVAAYSCGINNSYTDCTLTASGGTINATGASGVDYSDGIYTDSLIISGGTVNATAGASTNQSFGVYNENSITISGGILNATAGASTDSYGVYCDEGILAITGSTLVASGYTSALNKAPDLTALSSYTYWTNTSITAPGGNGTKFPSTAYSWSTSQKYVKITTEKISTNTTSNTPKTGDISNIFVLSISVLISILAMLSIVVWKKRQMVKIK